MRSSACCEVSPSRTSATLTSAGGYGSLDVPTVRDDDEAASLVDVIGAEDSAYELVEDRDAIASVWKALPEVERKVIELRFMSDLTQRETGERIGYSQMQISRLIRRALSCLQDAAAAAA